MDAAKLLQDLSRHDGFPVEAVRAAEAERTAAVPIFLDAIEQYLAAGKAADGPRLDALFLIFHLLGAWRETAAYRPLARLLRSHRTNLDRLFGDAITVTTHRVMAAVFDGDPEPLFEIVRDKEADEFVRSRMCEALAMAVVHQGLSRDDVALFLRDIYPDLQPEPECFVWNGWQGAVALLHLTELAPLVEEAFTRKYISPGWLELRHFREDLSKAGSDPAAFFGDGKEFSLFGDVVEELSSWECYQPRKKSASKRDARPGADAPHGVAFDPLFSAHAPVHNPYRNVGRNDPCPCGSGKKFKKCCLGKAAEGLSLPAGPEPR